MVFNHISVGICTIHARTYSFFTAIIKNEIVVLILLDIGHKLTIILSFIFPKIEWEEKLSKKEQYIFCPNHASTLDVPFILAVLPIPLQYIGKAEIAKIPLFRILLQREFCYC